MANKEEVKKEYENTSLSIAKIGTKFGISPNTIKSWKARDKKDGCDWVKKKKKSATKKKKGADKLEEVVKEVVKLSLKQEQFCQEYIIDLNATRSYQDVYKSTYNTARTEGSKLLAKPNIQDRIHEFMSDKDSERIAKQDEVLEFLTSAMRGEVKENRVISNNDGSQEIIEVAPKLSDRVKSGELLGKRYRLFVERVENTDVKQPIFSGEDEL